MEIEVFNTTEALVTGKIAQCKQNVEFTVDSEDFTMTVYYDEHNDGDERHLTALQVDGIYFGKLDHDDDYFEAAGTQLYLELWNVLFLTNKEVVKVLKISTRNKKYDGYVSDCTKLRNRVWNKLENFFERENIMFL